MLRKLIFEKHFSSIIFIIEFNFTLSSCVNGRIIYMFVFDTLWTYIFLSYLGMILLVVHTISDSMFLSFLRYCFIVLYMMLLPITSESIWFFWADGVLFFMEILLCSLKKFLCSVDVNIFLISLVIYKYFENETLPIFKNSVQFISIDFSNSFLLSSLI